MKKQILIVMLFAICTIEATCSYHESWISNLIYLYSNRQQSGFIHSLTYQLDIDSLLEAAVVNGDSQAVENILAEDTPSYYQAQLLRRMAEGYGLFPIAARLRDYLHEEFEAIG